MRHYPLPGIMWLRPWFRSILSFDLSTDGNSIRWLLRRWSALIYFILSVSCIYTGVRSAFLLLRLGQGMKFTMFNSGSLVCNLWWMNFIVSGVLPGFASKWTHLSALHFLKLDAIFWIIRSLKLAYVKSKCCRYGFFFMKVTRFKSASSVSFVNYPSSPFLWSKSELHERFR